MLIFAQRLLGMKNIKTCWLGIVTVLLITNCNLSHNNPGLFINEISCISGHGYIDTISQKPIDWIELYNGYDKDIVLNDYQLQYIKNDTSKWHFPKGTYIKANNYLLINADKLDSALHTNFKLSSKSGTILLLNANNTKIDEVVYETQHVNTSYGRRFDSDSNWVFFDFPSPLASNNKQLGAKKNKVSDPPKFKIPGGFYDKPIKVTFQKNKNTTIYYTTNGDAPTSNDEKYKKPIPLDFNTVVRAIAIEKNKIASLPITNTYFFNNNKTLPIISLSLDHKSLWDSVTGIYELSLRGIERFGNIEFFDNHEQVINQTVDVKISGNFARYHGIKALQIVANKDYGNKYINYQVFPEKEVENYSALLLRGGGHPDKYHTTFRDGMSQYLTNEYFNLDHSGYRAVVVYLNASYWGIYNIREKGNENFIADNYNISTKDFSMLQNSWAKVRLGDRKHYLAMTHFLDKCDKSNPANYDSIKAMMDVDNFINYTIIETYVANVDWPHWNTKYWRMNNDTAKWRWILNDLDFGTGAGQNFKFDMIGFITSEVKTRNTNPPRATKLFRNLFEFKEFKNEYIQRLAVSINEIYSYQRMCTFVDKYAGEKRSEIPYHIEKWGYSEYESPWNMTFRIPQNIEEWELKVDKIKKFAKARPFYMYKNTVKKFNLEGTTKISTIAKGGEIVLNSIAIKKELATGIYFKNIPFRISARAFDGYQFSHWIINGAKHLNPNIVFTPKEKGTIEAVFTPNTSL
jgi:hypothetical protein